MNTKEGNLVSATLIYAMRCLVEGDMLALQHMQFGEREISALRELSILDLYRAESLKVHCLSIGLNRQVFWPMIEALKRERESDEQVNELIGKDAPFELMNELFGMATREYSARRRHFPANLGQGRPRLPEQDLEDELYRAWRKRMAEHESGEMGATDWLELQNETKVSLRAMFHLISRWRKEGARFE